MKAIIAVAMLSVAASPVMANNFSDPTPISIPSLGQVISTVNVSGMSGEISGLSVSIYGYEHSFPDDVAVGIFSEANEVGFVFLSGVGGSFDVNNITLTFSDFASYALPVSSVNNFPMISGSYLPSNYAGNYFVGFDNVTSFSGFNGLNPNGNWTLVVVDTIAGDSGSIAGGWSIDIATANTAVPEPATWAMMIGGFSLVGASMRRRKVAVSYA